MTKENGSGFHNHAARSFDGELPPRCRSRNPGIKVQARFHAFPSNAIDTGRQSLVLSVTGTAEK